MQTSYEISGKFRISGTVTMNKKQHKPAPISAYKDEYQNLTLKFEFSQPIPTIQIARRHLRAERKRKCYQYGWSTAHAPPRRLNNGRDAPHFRPMIHFGRLCSIRTQKATTRLGGGCIKSGRIAWGYQAFFLGSRKRMTPQSIMRMPARLSTEDSGVPASLSMPPSQETSAPAPTEVRLSRP